MIREEFNQAEWQFPFVMYRPAQMQENLPLIVQLHGAGEAGKGGEDLHLVDVHGFTHMMSETAEFPCIFVMPQCAPDSFWVAEMNNIAAFIEKLIKTFSINEKKVYLTGLSMGGYGTWYTALRYPKLFAAIAPVCGGGMVWKTYELDMAVWAFHGAIDDVVYPSETMNMIQKIRAYKVNKQEVKMTILDNVGHDAWVHAYNEDLYNWLLSKSR